MLVKVVDNDYSTLLKMNNTALRCSAARVEERAWGWNVFFRA